MYCIFFFGELFFLNAEWPQLMDKKYRSEIIMSVQNLL